MFRSLLLDLTKPVTKGNFQFVEYFDLLKESFPKDTFTS